MCVAHSNADDFSIFRHLPQEVIEREAAFGGLATGRVREFYHHPHTGAEPVGVLSSCRRSVVVKSNGIAGQAPPTPQLKGALTSLPPPLPSLPPAFGTKEWSRNVPGGNEFVKGGRGQRGALMKGKLGFRPVALK